jgi:hypothetical protein
MSPTWLAVFAIGVWMFLQGISIHVTHVITLIFAIIVLALLLLDLFGVQVPTRPARTP